VTNSLLDAYDTQVRGSESVNLPAGVYAEADGPITRVVGNYRGFVSGPVDLGLTGSALDALIVRQREFFAARGEAVEWKTRGHDRPADLAQRLAAAGFVPEPTETVVIGLAARLAAHQPDLPNEVRLRSVTDEIDLRRVAAMESEVWGEDWSWLAADLAARVRAGGITILVAEVGDRVVAAAWLVAKPGTDFAGLWGGSTLAEWRGRGVYRALVGRRAAIATAAGVRYLQVDASDDSRPILERLGFVAVTTTTPYVWTPSR
jgi:GNAT superfamily N-acetyltransferase